MDRKLKAACRVAHHEPLPIEQWFYIYHWGVSPTHLSGRAPYDAFYAEVGQRPLATDRFELKPRWVNVTVENNSAY
ncbi:MAG: hypothetical protein Tsb009_10790 [Planctomycetaceae bacterium]